jgi:acyl-CoA-binding protein
MVWDSYKNMSQDDARKDYISLVGKLSNKYK